MDATQPIYKQVQKVRKMWRELWWSMAGGIKSEYDKIKSTPVFEFWAIFDMWKEKLRQEHDTLKHKNKKHVRAK